MIYRTIRILRSGVEQRYKAVGARIICIVAGAGVYDRNHSMN
jgi:hypothetical protein